jgi:tripartite-type tricarboxylate transporter receptor subunit TctC
MPADIQAKVTASLKKAFESKEYSDFMNARGFGMKFADGPGFAKFMEDGDKAMASAMKAAGLSKA